MKRIVYKITLLMLAGMHITSAHAMWTQAARIALATAGKRTLSSHAMRSLSTIAPDEYVLQSSEHKALKLNAPSTFAYAPYIEDQSSDSNYFNDQKETNRNYQYSDESFKGHNFRHKGFICRSLISALALYAYASAQQQDCYAQELPETEPVESSCRVEEAIETIEPYTYTINLMWVNRKFEPNQKYIHPSKTLEELEQNLLNTAYGWAASNPESTVNIWYDSAFLTPEAIQNTQDAIDSYLSTRSENARIELKDVRELSVVQDNPEVFSDKTPVYFRVDLLRLIETIDVLTRSEELTYFIYVDLDAQPMPHDELFDNETLFNLKKYGIIVSKDTKWDLGFENGFHIMSNHKPNLITAVNRALIELNIVRGENALNGDFKYLHLPYAEFTPIRALSQIVYHSYMHMFLYFLHLEGAVQLHNGDLLYDYESQGLELFGSRVFSFEKTQIITNDQEIIEKNATNENLKWLGPTKKIDMPPAQLLYDKSLPDSEKALLKAKLIKEILILGGIVTVSTGVLWWALSK